MSIRTEHSPVPRSAPPASRQSRAPTTDSHLRTILTVGRTAANTPSVRAHIWSPSRAAPTSTTPNDQRAFQMREIDENLPHANPPALSDERRQIINDILARWRRVHTDPIQPGEFGPRDHGWFHEIRRDRLQSELPILTLEERRELTEDQMHMYMPQRQDAMPPPGDDAGGLYINGGGGEGSVEDMDLTGEEREALDANELQRQALDYYENQQRIGRPEYSHENYPELMDQTSPIAIRIMIQDLDNNVTLRRNIMVTFETTYPGYGENVLTWAAVSHNMVREPERSFIDAVRARLGDFLMDTDAVQMYTPRPYGTLDMMSVRNRVFAAAQEIASENNAQATMRENWNGTGWTAIYILRNNPRLPERN